MKTALMTWKTEFGALSYERYWEVTGTLYRIGKKSFIKIVKDMYKIFNCTINHFKSIFQVSRFTGSL